MNYFKLDKDISHEDEPIFGVSDIESDTNHEIFYQKNQTRKKCFTIIIMMVPTFFFLVELISDQQFINKLKFHLIPYLIIVYTLIQY